MKIYHNPRCTKSRDALGILEEKGFSPEVVLYLKDPLGINELEDVLKKLEIAPSELIRKNEKIFKETYKDKELSEEEWLLVLLENPILMERPIVVHQDKAIIARPPELALTIM